MADLITNTFRKYQETGKGRWPGKAITITKSKTDYSRMEVRHADADLNDAYIKAGAARDLDRPLCVALHQGKICMRQARRGTRYCWLGRGDE